MGLVFAEFQRLQVNVSVFWHIISGHGYPNKHDMARIGRVPSITWFDFNPGID